jgi:hypothetical protein
MLKIHIQRYSSTSLGRDITIYDFEIEIFNDRTGERKRLPLTSFVDMIQPSSGTDLSLHELRDQVTKHLKISTVNTEMIRFFETSYETYMAKSRTNDQGYSSGMQATALDGYAHHMLYPHSLGMHFIDPYEERKNLVAAEKKEAVEDKDVYYLLTP